MRLLRASLPEAIDPAAAAQIVAATGGNPLALVDLAGELSVRRLTESSLADEPLPIGHHLESLYLRRIRHLTPDLQVWLLIAAADSTGNIDLIRAAGQSWGLPEDPVDEAESAGLVELDDAIRFRHPLVRSAAYNAAQGAQRRRAHRALATAADQLGPGRGRGVACGQGHPRHRPGRGRPARTSRGRGWKARRSLVTGAAPGPVLHPDPDR